MEGIMKKRKYGRILSLVLTICMVLGMLPVSMLDGIAKVSAAESTTDTYGIVKTVVDENTTTWDFTKEKTEDNNFAGKETSGISFEGTKASSVGLKATYVRIYGSRSTDTDPNQGKMVIPLDSKTTKVKVTIVANSLSDGEATLGDRYIIVGNSNTYVNVYQKGSHEECFDSSTKTWSKELDSDYFTDGKLVIAGGVGENKINSIKIEETKAGTTGLVDVNKTYKFTWDDNDSDKVIPSTSAGNAPSYSADGKVTVDCGPNNAYQNHNDKYGTAFKPGNTISVKVNGDAKIVLAGTSNNGGATISVVDGNGESIGSEYDNMSTQTTGEFTYPYNVLETDASKTITINYTGEATTLTIKFLSGTTYCPWMTVYCKEEVELVDVNKTYKYTWDDNDSDKVIPSTSAGNAPSYSADGKVTVDCGPNNAYQNHNDKYGTAFKPGNTISVKVNGDAKIVLAGTSNNGGATISVVDGNGESIGSEYDNMSTQTTGEFTYPYNVLETDASKTITINYTGEATTLKITFLTGTTYCPWMTVYYKDKAPEAEPVNIPVQIAEASQSILGTDKVVIAEKSKPDTKYEVGAAGDTLNLMTKTEYTVSTDNEKLKATVDGKTSFTTGTEVATVTVVVESLVVNPTVSLKADSTLADGKKISITKDAVTTDLTVGQPVELWIGGTYSITCDDDTVEARVGGKTSFTATSDMTNLEVELVPTASTVAMTVNGDLGSSKVVFTNVDDNNDRQEFGNGDSITLKLNATYNITCTNEDLNAKVEGKSSYKVEDSISALTVVLSKKEYHTYDVWDFGAEQLVSNKYVTYNNKITADTINGWYGSGTTLGQKLVVDDESYILSKQDNKWRLYTNTPGVKCYGGFTNPATDEDGNNFQGYLYSNSTGTTNYMWFALKVKAGDIVTAKVSSNSGASDVTWKSPSGNDVQVYTYTGVSKQEFKTVQFTASEDGEYTLYSANEKLVVARIYREHPANVDVTGNVLVSSSADMSNAELVFTQKFGDRVINTVKTKVVNGKYNVSLQEGYTYELSLDGANGYIVDTIATRTLNLKNGDSKTGKTFPVTITGVDLVTVKGSLAALTKEDAAKLQLTLENQDANKPYKAEFKVNEGTNNFTAVLEKGETYNLIAENVDDYTLGTTTISASSDGTQNIVFTKKPVYGITVTLNGVPSAQIKNVKLTFSYVKNAATGELDSRYVYTYTGTSNIKLRDGQYKVTAELDGYAQGPTADVKVAGAASTATVIMKSTAPAAEVPYKETITVNQSGGADYASINEALEAVRNMKRDDSQRVTISIAPGDYEEMLVVDVPNVTLKNASATPSIALKNNGVNIDDNAVRITSYYGHGYNYYSMGSDYKWNEDVLAANKANNYASTNNPGAGSATFWNATVEIQASGFQADNIIFENSFNQYVSKKAAADTIVKLSDKAKDRYTLAVGSTAVQQKSYVERAAALAIGNGKSDITFNGCKFIGRQDTLYGGINTYAEFNQCSVYGGTDYIFGGMTAIFDKCDLVFNTTDDNNDVGYITAAQQKSGRGYFMNECHVTSVVPGVDVDATYATHTSKPGYFGRPWQVNTSEVVFYKTTIDQAYNGGSLIAELGWNDSLSGQSAGMYEYGTVELSGVDNSAKRASWATMLTGTNPKLNDGTYISKNAFRRTAAAGLYQLNISAGLKAGVDYDGGICVLEDMPYKTDGYVQGSNNAKYDATTGIPTSGAVLKLTAKADGRLKINMKSAGGKTVYWVDADNAGKSKNWVSNVNETVVFPVEAGHTYYFYGNGTKVCLYAVSVDYRPYESWDSVAAPTLGTPVAAAIGSENEGTITVPYSAAVGSVYSESMQVRVLLDGELVETVNVTDETDPLKNFESEFVYEPAKSGKYTFQVMLKRSGEASKVSNESSEVSFKLPMKQPVIVNTENTGSGNVKLSWQAVTEATSYDIYLNGEKIANTKDLFYRYDKLTIGTEYRFGVVALGNSDASDLAESTLKVTSNGKKNWQFSAFGSGVDSKNNGYEGSYDSGKLKVFSKSGKGKLVPNSTDGLAFYYTTIDPETENFTLTADVTVDTWTYSNGQEGFGLMAADNVGVDGDASVFWNNSYMASVTKVEYFWDANEQKVSDVGDKYSMYLGVGAQEKTGVTQDNLAGMNDGSAVSEFNTKMHPLDLYAPMNGYAPGQYNRVGSMTGANKAENLDTKTKFKLTIQRNNTGYFLSYTDEAGVTTTKKFYHGDDGDELTKLDPNNIYVGFFASRNAEISVSNMQLTVINPKDDAPAEERPITYVTPNVSFESSSMSNSEDYELVYYGNVDGKLYVAQGNKTLAAFIDIKANTKYKFNTKLVEGDNTFVCKVAPDLKYCPSKYEKLSSYDVIDFTKTVTYKNNTRNVVYVAPSASSKGVGSKENPKSIYEAVKWAAPGDVIMLMGGTYNMDSTLIIDRGIDGTAEKNITMMADPESGRRPVFNFGKKCAGMIFAGDYWYFKGFDVTNSAAGQKGIQVSGSNNTLDGIRTYKNGNTGVQISRYKSTDLKEDWPANNLILNCTSYLNADPGYEDADGFAAKLTIGEGNVFDGCISAYNADDGWDLFAKIETGPIGKVVIRNSIAFKNGYVISDVTGAEINAGNGNGFKMGGESITGYHTLENSIAFGNKSKGIDSNSCPDNQVKNSTSFDNESYNVALYTNNAKNTDYSASGIISYKKSNTEGENIRPKGMQDESLIYNLTNYFFNGSKSTNGKEVVTDDWFVSLDMNKAIHGGITRNADGSINMNGFLELVDASKGGANLKGSSTSSPSIEVPELVVDEETEKEEQENNVAEPDYDYDDDDTDSTPNGSSSDESTDAEENEVLKPEDIPGSTVTQVDGVDFAELGEISYVAEKIIEAVDANGKVSADVEVIKDTTSVANKIIESINADNSNEVIVFASEGTSVSKQVFDKLKETGKTLSIGVVDGQGKVNAIVTIDGTKIKSASVNFNLKVTVDAKSNAISSVATKAGINNDKVTIVDFKYSGTLPGTLKTAVNVANKYTDGTKLALYYYNAKKGVLENQYQLTTVSNGYAEFAIDHCSQYVLVDVTAAEGTITTGTIGSPKTADTSAMIMWIFVMLAAVLALAGYVLVYRKRRA